MAQSQYPIEPPSYEASTGGVGGYTGVAGNYQAPPLPEKSPFPTAPQQVVSTIPLTAENGVVTITSDMIANFAAGQTGQKCRQESTNKHRRVLKIAGIWQILSSGALFVLAIIKHVHGFRMYGLFGYSSAAAGLLAATAAIITSNRPVKCSIVASVVLGTLALLGGVAAVAGNSLMWRCPYIHYRGWCSDRREARTTIAFSLFAACLELAFAFAQILIASILLCRKESGRMAQNNGPASVNFVLQVMPGTSQVAVPVQDQQ